MREGIYCFRNLLVTQEQENWRPLTGPGSPPGAEPQRECIEKSQYLEGELEP